MISNVLMVSKYGSKMGVFYEWSPLVFRIFQRFAPKGVVGITFVEQLATKAIERWNQLSEKEGCKRDEEVKEGDDLLTADMLSSFLAKHRNSPKSFTIADAYYHVIPTFSPVVTRLTPPLPQSCIFSRRTQEY